MDSTPPDFLFFVGNSHSASEKFPILESSSFSFSLRPRAIRGAQPRRNRAFVPANAGKDRRLQIAKLRTKFHLAEARIPSRMAALICDPPRSDAVVGLRRPLFRWQDIGPFPVRRRYDIGLVNRNCAVDHIGQ